MSEETKVEFENATYEIVAPGIAKIMQARPEARNAQNAQLTYDLNDCFDLAAQDEEVKVILFGGEGPHFSSGHDLRGFGPPFPQRDFKLVNTWGMAREGGVHSRYSFEQEVFMGMCQRWRDMPKPTIAWYRANVSPVA